MALRDGVEVPVDTVGASTSAVVVAVVLAANTVICISVVAAKAFCGTNTTTTVRPRPEGIWNRWGLRPKRYAEFEEGVNYVFTEHLFG
jgi:hypothetical protein